MNTEEAWRAWWDAEGKHMERLPHHNAIDHMASVTRIAWLNGAFDAADQIDQLLKQRDDARQEVCKLESEKRGERLKKECSGTTFPVSPNRIALERGWNYFKEQKS